MTRRRTIIRTVAAALTGCVLLSGLAAGAAEGGTPAQLWIGAASKTFADDNRNLGPLRYQRCFDVTLPTSFQQSCAGNYWAAGHRAFVSWKPPGLDYIGAAAGAYDAQIMAWARSVPTNIGLYATVWHEPENDMTGPQYVAMFQRVYAVVKAANPSITFGPVYMSYWWLEGSDHYAPGGPNAWWVWSRYADFVGVDNYAPNPTPLQQDPKFQGWLRFVNAKAPTKPLVMAEYGQYKRSLVDPPDPAKQAARARTIPIDESYLRSMRFTMWLLWNVEPWRLTDTGSQVAWRTVASRGRPA